jgi:hypothetical protein
MTTRNRGGFTLIELLVVMGGGIGIGFETNWGSAHTDAAQLVVADGCVRSLRFGLDGMVMHALLTPAGGEVINPDP